MNNKGKKSINPKELIASLPDPRKSEIVALDKLIRKAAPTLKVSPELTKLYGMIGYGKFRYKYATGREGDWFVIGLASQKNYISLYCCMTENGQYIAEGYKKLLPKASIGKSCVRFKKLSDIDIKNLEKLIKHTARAYKNMKK